MAIAQMKQLAAQLAAQPRAPAPAGPAPTPAPAITRPPGPAPAGPTLTWTCVIDPLHRFTGGHDAYLRYVRHYEDQPGPQPVDDSGRVAGPHMNDLKVITFRSPDNPVYSWVIDSAALANEFGFPDVFVSAVGGAFNWFVKPIIPAVGFYGLWVTTPAQAGFEDLTRDPHLVRLYHGLHEIGGTQKVGGGNWYGVPTSILLNRTVSRIELASYGRDEKGNPSGTITSGSSLVVRGFARRGRVRREISRAIPPIAAVKPMPSIAPTTGRRLASGETVAVYDVEITGDPEGRGPALYLMTIPEQKGEDNLNRPDDRLRREIPLTMGLFFWVRQTDPAKAKSRVGFVSTSVPEFLNSLADTNRGNLAWVYYDPSIGGKFGVQAPGFRGLTYPFPLGCDPQREKEENEEAWTREQERLADLVPDKNALDWARAKWGPTSWQYMSAMMRYAKEGPAGLYWIKYAMVQGGLRPGAAGAVLVGPAANALTAGSTVTAMTIENYGMTQPAKLAEFWKKYWGTRIGQIGPVPIGGVVGAEP